MIHDHALMIRYEEYVHQVDYICNRHKSATTWMVSVYTLHIDK